MVKETALYDLLEIDPSATEAEIRVFPRLFQYLNEYLLFCILRRRPTSRWRRSSIPTEIAMTRMPNKRYLEFPPLGTSYLHSSTP